MKICILLLLVSASSFAQKTKPITACTQSTFAAFKPLPKLDYACTEGLIDSDDKILKLPERLAAISEVAQDLRSLANAAWWEANVDDLNACEMHRSAGALTDEEKAHFKDGDYQFLLFGNQQIRLVLVRDPCYQTEFNGSNLFVLYRTGGQVFVSEVIDGFFSRADSFLDVAFANLNGEQLIEVSTASGGLYPYVVNHYHWGPSLRVSSWNGIEIPVGFNLLPDARFKLVLRALQQDAEYSVYFRVRFQDQTIPEDEFGWDLHLCAGGPGCNRTGVPFLLSH